MNVTAMKAGKADRKIDSAYQAALGELSSNELIFAVVGPVGSGTSTIATSLEQLLNAEGYETSVLKARAVIEKAAMDAGIAIPSEAGLAQTRAMQDVGDKIRAHHKDNAAIAVGLIDLIRNTRASKQASEIVPGEAVQPDGKRRAYILDSLRHPHEAMLLRRVYQEAFCLVGVFCHEDERLSRMSGGKYIDAGRKDIELFMERDENAPEAHGQRVADAFHLADYFVDNTAARLKPGEHGEPRENAAWDVPEQLGRLLRILTHSAVVRPRSAETGMFHAYGAMMRSSCLSRQVGASLLDGSGELIATGANEVPRAGGGVYGGVFANTSSGDLDEAHDFRCFAKNKFCSNTREQNAIIEELFDKVEELKSIKLTPDLLGRLRKTRIGQLIEFSRAVHAEMDALLSAARSGARTTDTHLFVTTFPCHNCARHIVSAGVVEVQYIEPYLKSQAIKLHGDSIVTNVTKWKRSINGGNEGRSQHSNVLFRPFIGVAPRLYRRAFLKDRDLKNSRTGDMLESFPLPTSHAAIETLRVSYAQAEALLSLEKLKSDEA